MNLSAARVYSSNFLRWFAFGLLLASPALYATDGALDPGFVSAINGAKSIALQSDGKIVLARGANISQVTRLNGDGSLDSHFAALGNYGTNSVDFVHVAQDDGILAAGTSQNFNGSGFPYMKKYAASGASAADVFHPGVSFVLTAKALSDGKTIIAGSSWGAPGYAFNTSWQNSPWAGITRMLPNGAAADDTFNPGTGINGYGMNIWALAVQSDDKYIIGGNFTSYNGVGRNRIARISTNGALDATFNPGTGANADVKAIVVQPNGKIVIGGNFTTVNDFSISGIARLNSNGSRDTTFNAGAAVDSSVRGIVLQPDGKMLVGTATRLVRLQADGTLDATFSSGLTAVNAIVLQADRKLLVAGNSYLVRLNALGFDSDGDGTNDDSDNCPSAANADQLNTDSDTQGNVCDADDDNDGVPDASDVYPLDTDNDGVPNITDADDDNDGVPDYIDADPLNTAINTEKLLPVNGGYQGSVIRESQTAQ